MLGNPKMTNEVTIRPAFTGDLNAIGNLWKEFMDFHKSRDVHFSRSTDGHERFIEFISGHLSSDTSSVLIAERDGELVGYCLATLAKYPPVFEAQYYGAIFDLAVTERYRRNGIGEKLYEAVQGWLAEHEVHRIEVRVAISNEISKAFWKKMGFEPYVETAFKTI
jgi:ribosomal protein S18 acetylase RimI-like enzyme